MSQNVVILAPRLKNLVGHEFEYTKAVASELRRKGCGVRIIGSLAAEAPVTSLPGFEGLFPLLPQSSHPGGILRQAALFSGHLREIVPLLGIGSRDILFVHTIPHAEFLGWHWAFPHVARDCGRLVFFFRYSLNLAHRWDAKISRIFLRALYRKFARKHHNLPSIVSDSPELKQEFESLLSLPVSVFPIPLNDQALGAVACRRRGKLRNGRARLAYIGDARYGRGFDLLPDAILGILAQRPQVDFMIHCGRNLGPGDDPAVLKTVRRFSSMPDTVHFSMGPLSYDDYLSRLQEADALLIPCRREHYGPQTSNVLTEAFACSLPVVVPEDTWMANRVRETGAGTIFQSGNIGSLIRNAISLIDGLDHFSDAAKSNQPTWIGYHNAKGVASRLLSLANP